jgi:hypothetical protein
MTQNKRRDAVADVWTRSYAGRRRISGSRFELQRFRRSRRRDSQDYGGGRGGGERDAPVRLFDPSPARARGDQRERRAEGAGAEPPVDDVHRRRRVFFVGPDAQGVSLRDEDAESEVHDQERGHDRAQRAREGNARRAGGGDERGDGVRDVRSRTRVEERAAQGAARDASHPSEQEHRTEALEAHPDVLAQRGEGGADQTDE